MRGLTRKSHDGVSPVRTCSPSDLTDEQRTLIEPLIPVHNVGRSHDVDMREVLNMTLYLDRSRCQ